MTHDVMFNCVIIILGVFAIMSAYYGVDYVYAMDENDKVKAGTIADEYVSAMLFFLPWGLGVLFLYFADLALTALGL